MTAHPTLKPRQGILEIAPYQAGASKAAHDGRVFKLSSNENPLGPSPAAIDAYRAVGAHLHLYPDGGHTALRAAIGEVYDLDPARIVCGAGSDEIICMLCKAYAGPGDEVLHSAHGFLMYKLYALGAGATPVSAPESQLHTDIDAMIAALTDCTRLVFVADPNSPTGTMVGIEALTRLADALPPRAMLVIDGAYAEYLTGYDGGAALVEERDNVVMTRTFSKIHGLGALRLGWGYGPAHVVDVINRIRGPFNVTAGALAAGEAAVRDQDWVAHCLAENAKWRGWLAEELSRIGIPSTPSHANFLLAHIGPDAGACEAHMASQGVLVRGMAGYGLPQHLRITVGDADGCHAVVASIADWQQSGARAAGQAG
ncbi:MAG: histidinol-phosphate transaminase [Pseudomonadota bacterium]